MSLTALSDAELVAALKTLVAREHAVLADVVEHLAEVDGRGLFLTAGCSSLTAYCRERLGYSEFEAGHRVTAARLVRQYPMILPLLRAGSLSLSTLRTVAPVLTAENHQERLEAAIGKTRNELERIVAGWAPKPELPTRIVAVKSAEPPALLLAMTATADVAPEAASTASAQTTPSPQPPSRPAPLPRPLTPERFALQVTIDAETYESLMKLRDHMRHAIPDGDVAKILKRAVTDLRASVEARKFGKRKTVATRAAKPSDGRGPSSELRHPSEPIIDDGEAMPRGPGRASRRDVAERDGYQCTYVSNDGHRCTSTSWLEHDHKLDYALNGPTWTPNLQLLCHAHHRLKHAQHESAGYHQMPTKPPSSVG